MLLGVDNIALQVRPIGSLSPSDIQPLPTTHISMTM